MAELSVEVVLRGDAVFSAASAVGSAHETLAYVPGSTLLGAAAGRLYAALESGQALTVFHSGKVRFGCLRPARGEHISYPVPLSWHHDKGSAAHVVKSSGGARFEAASLRNLSHERPQSSGRQPVSIKRGFVTLAGDWLRPERRVHLKSARDRAKRRTREGALFAYEALCSGQTFRGTLSWDDDVAPELIDQVVATLRGSKRLGRSRAAEFGRVEVSLGDPCALPALEAAQDRVTLLCVSDVALRSSSGAPTLRPTPQAFGLPAEARWLSEQSFVRTRSYAPFNGKRRAPDLDRHVLRAGSVLVFEIGQPLEVSALEALSRARHGLHLQDGLGEVLFNPSFLGGARPRFTAAPEEQERRPRPSCPAGPLAQWASRQVASRRAADASVAIGLDLRTLLDTALRRLRSDQRPPASQWRVLLGVVRGAQSSQLATELHLALHEGVAKLAWEAPLWLEETTSLAALIERETSRIAPELQAEALAYALAEIARQVAAEERS